MLSVDGVVWPLQIFERFNPLLHLIEVVGAWHVVQRSHKRFHCVNALLNLCIVMLTINFHDRVGDSPDFLSMLSDGLVAMLLGYAMCVDRPREVLKGVNILLDLSENMLPFNVINRAVHLFQLVHILDDFCKCMVAFNSIDWSNHLFHLLCCFHDLSVVVFSVNV